MALIKKHTIQFDNGNTETTIKLLGITVTSHETEKYSNTVEGRLSMAEKRLDWNQESIQRIDMK